MESWRDKLERYDFKIKHTNPTVTIVFTSEVDEDANNESWGVWGI